MITTRKLLLALIAAAVLASVIVAVTVGGGGHQPKRTAARSTTTIPSLASQGLSPQIPDTIPVSQSPVQVATDQQIAQLTGNSPGLRRSRP